MRDDQRYMTNFREPRTRALPGFAAVSPASADAVLVSFRPYSTSAGLGILTGSWCPSRALKGTKSQGHDPSIVLRLMFLRD